MEQKHSIFVCRASGAFYSFLTKIACSEVPSGFVLYFATGSQFYGRFNYNAEALVFFFT